MQIFTQLSKFAKDSTDKDVQQVMSTLYTLYCVHCVCVCVCQVRDTHELSASLRESLRRVTSWKFIPRGKCYPTQVSGMFVAHLYQPVTIATLLCFYLYLCLTHHHFHRWKNRRAMSPPEEKSEKVCFVSFVSFEGC